MIKNVLIIGLLFLLFTGVGNAAIIKSGYSFDGNGLPEYPNEGVIWATVYAAYEPGGESDVSFNSYTDWYDTNGNTVDYYCSGRAKTQRHNLAAAASSKFTTYPSSNDVVCSVAPPQYDYAYSRGTFSKTTSIDCRGIVACSNANAWFYAGTLGYASVVITITTSDMYSITGNTSCLDSVQLNNSNGFLDKDFLEDGSFNFTHLIDGHTYTLIFDDAHEYEFTVNGSNIVYDYDGCSHTQYRFEESCGNLIPDIEGYYTEYEDFWATAWDFYEPSGILDISNSSAIRIALHSQTFIGDTGWIIDPVVSDTTYMLENPNIAWGLKVIVQNGSDGTLIDGAMVKVDQTCYCTSGYSTRQKTTVNGMVEFCDMSLQDASLFVMASGYKILNENTTGYDASLSGRTNFSSKTWVVKMAPTWSNNTSTFYESGNKVDIHFRNEDGNRTSQILDTDTEVYLYYENNNSNEEAMTLKFQSSSTHSHFIDEDSWTIAHDDIGHKTIPQADFTPWTYAYRAVIYNSSIYGWNLTIPLTVRNETKEETLHYENLTTNLWFRHEADGKIDYREDMQIVSHARSNNTTLMNIDLEVWKDGGLLCYINLTETDYENADFPYYYVYEPVYEYVPGSNYTAKMYGFDRTLLEVRYLECINDTVTRKNKLTVGVKDRTGTNLGNCYIYLENWGSLSTGSTYYNSYEGIDNGYYRYKAAKSGYTGTGWADITMSDDDEIVWYTLTEDHTNLSITQQKLTDDDIKGMFFPLMFFLLICIIFGGFKYVTN